MSNLKEVITQRIWDSRIFGLVLLGGAGLLLGIEKAERATLSNQEGVRNSIMRKAGRVLGAIGSLIPERQQSNNDAE